MVVNTIAIRSPRSSGCHIRHHRGGGKDVVDTKVTRPATPEAEAVTFVILGGMLNR